MSEDWSSLWKAEHKPITDHLDELQSALASFRWEFLSLLERIDRMEAQLDKLGAQRIGSVQGLDGTVTVSCPPEWGGSVPLVEIEGVS